MYNPVVDTLQPKASWETPQVQTLPRLTELTLTTGICIPGEGGCNISSGGGSTVIP